MLIEVLVWSVTHEDGEAQIENAQATFKNYILTSDVILLYRRIIAIIIAIIIQENYCYNNIASCGISNVHLPLTDGIHSCRHSSGASSSTLNLTAPP